MLKNGAQPPSNDLLVSGSPVIGLAPCTITPIGSQPRRYPGCILYYANLVANFASEVLGEIEGNDGHFNDGPRVLAREQPDMATTGPRWGIVGTANIARSAFLPALAVAGGAAAAVAGRDQDLTARWASDHGVGRAITGYQNLIDDQEIDALYIPLPNSLHAEWTIAALRAGKPVLCEKPLCGTLADTERVLAVARETGTLLWEAFVFPFSEHMDRIKSLVADGAIGELAEVQSDFHFLISRSGNIRLSADLQGGALLDVGCYPVRLAQEFFGEHQTAWATRVIGGQAGRGASGVDLETWGSLGYAGDRRLLLSCGMRRGRDTFSRLLGTEGQIQASNLFHSRGEDFVALYPANGEPVKFPATVDEPAFTPALRHINAALNGEEEPRLLAVQTSLMTARALHDLAACP
jgi:predicted dehydrogenase